MLIATMQAAQAVPAAEESDASARFCATSGWRSRWPCPSSSTTPQEDRGGRRKSRTTLRSPGSTPPPGHSVWVCRGNDRLGWSGTPWSTWRTSAPTCRPSTPPRRRRRTTRRTPRGPRTPRRPSRSPKPPRPAHCAPLAPVLLSRSQRNSWWKCRPCCLPRASLCRSQSRSSAFQLLRVVFKVFSQNRVQQRRLLIWNAFLGGLWSRSLTHLSLEEVFKVFAQVRVHLRLRTVQLEFLKTQMSLMYGFFALFPGGKKCACRRESECGAAPGGLIYSGGLWVRHRRFAARLFIPPCAAGCGFIDCDAVAEFGDAAFGGFRVPVSWQGHFARKAPVTFSVRMGPDGFMEAYHVEAVGKERALTPSWGPPLAG